MKETIGAILPLGVGAALSPLPLIAVILMLASQHPARNGISFLVSSILGTAAITALMVGLALLLPVDPDAASHPVTGTIKIVLGIAMLFLGYRAWKGRPKPGTDPVLPAWMNKIDGMSAMQAAGFGLVLVVANTKNLPIEAAVGAHLAVTGSTVDAVVSGVVFVVLASLAMITVVAASLLFPKEAEAPIGRLRETLVAHNSVILTVVFVFCGATILGHGISAL